MMADGHPAEGDAEAQGVFGNLPRARPGVRSPRRDAGKSSAKPRKAATQRSKAGSRTTPRAKRAAPRPATAPPRPTPSEPPPPAGSGGEEAGSARGGGVEELAWAGITVAAEAATLGVRLLGRAVEAVRRPPDRQ
jgi:hypothetical protein